MVKYIHNTTQISAITSPELVQQLDELSNMGWEIVTAVPVVGYVQPQQEGEPADWYAQTILIIMRMPEEGSNR